MTTPTLILLSLVMNLVCTGMCIAVLRQTINRNRRATPPRNASMQLAVRRGEVHLEVLAVEYVSDHETRGWPHGVKATARRSDASGAVYTAYGRDLSDAMGHFDQQLYEEQRPLA